MPVNDGSTALRLRLAQRPTGKPGERGNGVSGGCDSAVGGRKGASTSPTVINAGTEDASSSGAIHQQFSNANSQLNDFNQLQRPSASSDHRYDRCHLLFR